MMSEWGATDNLTAIKIDAASADRHLMGWTHWADKHWFDPTTADGDQGLFTDDADLSSVKRAKVRVLVRTYAQAVAGTPLVMRFRPGSGRLWLRFRPDRSVSAATRIFVSPFALPARLPGRGPAQHRPPGRPLRAGPARLDRQRLDPDRLGAHRAALTLRESSAAAGTPDRVPAFNLTSP